jgi:hypothetical protein
MFVRLNKIQRGIAIGIAAVILFIQSAGILENGLEENRGWVWAFLVSAVLLVVGFAKPESQTPASMGSQSSLSPESSQNSRAMTSADKEQFATFMGRAVAAVNENGQMANRLLDFVLTNELYHKDGALSLVLDPRIHSALAAHALVVIGLAEAKTEPERIVWETYRTTLTHRLAEKRATRVAGALSPEGIQNLAKTDTKPEFLNIVKGEMEVWEKVARQALSQKDEVKYGSFLHHVSATFGGRKDPSDDDKFVPVLFDLLGYAKEKVIPVLAKSATPT